MLYKTGLKIGLILWSFNAFSIIKYNKSSGELTKIRHFFTLICKNYYIDIQLLAKHILHFLNGRKASSCEG